MREMPIYHHASEFTADDHRFMRRSLTLARRAWGRTSPNPMVGAVIVQDDGKTVGGEGWHRQAGKPHAEVEAIANAGNAAPGSTLYVTLEPCCTTGRTPPCTEAIVAAGIKRVVIGTLDPNPAHAGRAVKILQDAGIQVATGLQEQECRNLNEAFFHWITHKKPFVLLKMAMTLDGKIATAAGDSKWITGEKARAHVQRLRQWADAIMVGGETAIQDDPELTVRTPQNWPAQPRPIVWSTKPALPPALRLCSNPEQPPLLVQPRTKTEWAELLSALGRENINALLIEGGGELAANCLNAGIVDKLMFFVAPKILGGRDSRPVVGGKNPTALADSWQLEKVKTQKVGNDILISGYLPKQ
jgi:diaminohydroxyphosphoribosylaminopyrimidine deaminase / 5-amino-6-(5-phosphoribosylamino)uracil reductase